MRTRSLEQFAASAEQSFPASPSDAPAIRTHRVAFSFQVRPRLRSAIRFADVRANVERLEVMHRGATVIPLVRDHLFDYDDRFIRRDSSPLLSLPIDSRQISARRRPDAGGLGELGQKLFIALPAIASDDAVVATHMVDCRSRLRCPSPCAAL